MLAAVYVASLMTADCCLAGLTTEHDAPSQIHQSTVSKRAIACQPHPDVVGLHIAMSAPLAVEGQQALHQPCTCITCAGPSAVYTQSPEVHENKSCMHLHSQVLHLPGNVSIRHAGIIKNDSLQTAASRTQAESFIASGLGWAGLGWAGLGWAGLGWAGLG